MPKPVQRPVFQSGQSVRDLRLFERDLLFLQAMENKGVEGLRSKVDSLGDHIDNLYDVISGLTDEMKLLRTALENLQGTLAKTKPAKKGCS